MRITWLRLHSQWYRIHYILAVVAVGVVVLWRSLGLHICRESIKAPEPPRKWWVQTVGRVNLSACFETTTCSFWEHQEAPDLHAAVRCCYLQEELWHAARDIHRTWRSLAPTRPFFLMDGGLCGFNRYGTLNPWEHDVDFYFMLEDISTAIEVGRLAGESRQNATFFGSLPDPKNQGRPFSVSRLRMSSPVDFDVVGEWEGQRMEARVRLDQAFSSYFDFFPITLKDDGTVRQSSLHFSRRFPPLPATSIFPLVPAKITKQEGLDIFVPQNITETLQEFWCPSLHHSIESAFKLGTSSVRSRKGFACPVPVPVPGKYRKVYLRPGEARPWWLREDLHDIELRSSNLISPV